MKVLMITGDRNMFMPGTSAYERAALQKIAVRELKIIFWGSGALSIPDGRGFDVVTVQDPFWRGLVGWICARRAGARFNVQVHSDLSSQSFIRWTLAKIILGHADSIRVVSERLKQQVQKMGAKAPTTVLPIYVDVERFKQVVRSPDPDIKTLLWIGRFEAEKDPLYAIEIFKQVLQNGIKAKLVMLGAGTMEKDLKQLADDYEVEFPGWTDPLPYLAKADVVISTSPRESWGASIVEALASGVPVVATDTGIAKQVGAYFADRSDLSRKTIEILKSGERGELKFSPLSKDEWIKKWRESL